LTRTITKKTCNLARRTPLSRIATTACQDVAERVEKDGLLAEHVIAHHEEELVYEVKLRVYQFTFQVLTQGQVPYATARTGPLLQRLLEHS
jgi:hypothetical protein